MVVTAQVPHDDTLIRAALREAGLRCTSARVDVYRVLAAAEAPLAHREACAALSSMDRITVFRNLVALVEAGLAVRVDLGDRIWRYGLPEAGAHATPRAHPRHPHFTCTTCGDITCLDEVKLVGSTTLGPMLDGAEVQIRGVCTSCR